MVVSQKKVMLAGFKPGIFQSQTGLANPSTVAKKESENVEAVKI